MRVKILFPSNFIFSMQLSVRISDINYGGHVGNDSILTLVHEARIAFLKQSQLTELNCSGHGLIMADSAVQYKGESFHGDVLTIQIAIGNISTSAFDMFYKISTQRQDKTIDIAYVKTGMICFDYTNRKICTMSVPLFNTLTQSS